MPPQGPERSSDKVPPEVSARELSISELEPRMRPFSRALPLTMLRAREAMMQRFRPLLHEKSLTDQQWRIIRALAHMGSAEILDLSEVCIIHPASLSRILPKMEDAAYIKRRTNEADKRRVIVTLTDYGRALFESFGPRSEAVYESIERDIGAERMRELYDLLDHMIEALEHSPGHNS